MVNGCIVLFPHFRSLPLGVTKSPSHRVTDLPHDQDTAAGGLGQAGQVDGAVAVVNQREGAAGPGFDLGGVDVCGGVVEAGWCRSSYPHR